MSKLTIGEAAAVLHTAPSTIRSWEQRLGYPTPERSPSGRRLYDEDQVTLLADALRRGLSISSAIHQIREETGSHEGLLRQALANVDVPACDALLEAAIAMRGVSRAFDETILTAVESLAGTGDAGVVALAVQWASDRACWSRRQAVAPAHHDVLIVDGSAEATTTRAASSILQLQLALRGARTHVLHCAAAGDWRTVARRLDVVAVVFVGTLPPTAVRVGSIVSFPVGAFRAEIEFAHPRMRALPEPPRLAAEQLLATPSHDGALARA